MRHIFFLLFLLFAAVLFVPAISADDDAWNAIKSYQYGDDFKSLLAVEAEVQRSLASPETKIETAARLAALLDDNTTYPGRQFVCMQLRLVGGATEVPKLSEWLNQPEDSENVRLVLTDMQCEESLHPLRRALETFNGEAVIGIIGSVAARKDKNSIPTLVRLLDNPNRDIASAVVSALERFGREGLDALTKKKDLPGVGTARIGIANNLIEQGETDTAAEIFAEYTDTKYPVGLRRAAFSGLLRILSDEQRKKTIADWFFDSDPMKNDIAAFHLGELSDAAFDEMFKSIGKMGTRSRVIFFEIAAERKGEQLLESLLQALESNEAAERAIALRMIGNLGNPSTIPVLIAALSKDEISRNTAKEALARFPAPDVGPQLIAALQEPAIRDSAIDVIVAIKYYDAIDPMIRIAKSEENVDSVIAGLGRLCDPDEPDLPRLLDLYLSSPPGAKRERIERALVVVCEKNPDVSARADQLLVILEKRDGGLSGQLLIDTLPLLGRVGNKRVADMIRPLLNSSDEAPQQLALQRSAIRALCNWHNAEFLDDIWTIASEHSSAEFRQWALRAFIRVVTLRSDRPEGETLAMLKRAMSIAKDDADRQWCLSRAATIRTMETVDWAASFLDDSVLSQTACVVIVELAHHRFLREPNKTTFDPILLKVEQTAKDKEIVERAKKSRLGM